VEGDVRGFAVKRRRYRDKMLQGFYDAAVEAWLSGARGWVKPGQHGLWREDGTRFEGSSIHSAFWKGFDGFRRGPNRDQPLYVLGTPNYVTYMAGRDCGKSHQDKETRL
jgi:hypothetical protein